MKLGNRPRVNESHEFLEIAKDFKDSKEIIREALSNSWDANATKVSLKFDLERLSNSRKKKIMVEIRDDGEGMSSVIRPEIGTSELQDFYNLGDSHKPIGSIGTKGHGTKIYYKSNGIKLETWNNGRYLYAETEMPPWETLKNGAVPTYKYDDESTKEGKGTKIIIDGFIARQSDFDELYHYILLSTVAGSFCNYFNINKKMDVELKPINFPTPTSIPFGFKFPEENFELIESSDNYCKIHGPKIIEFEDENGNNIKLEIIGAIMGDTKRESLVSRADYFMGLWLCKDYIKIEKFDKIIEEVYRGEHWFKNMLIFVNCQQFDLTANRNNIREDEIKLTVMDKIKEYVIGLKNDESAIKFFETKKMEREKKDNDNKEKEDEKRRGERQNQFEQRINAYKGRADLNKNINGAPIKEPKSEAETALLLQALISTNHPGIDFRIGEYKTWGGTDLIIEFKSKGIQQMGWGELVHSLANIYAWYHPHECIHKIICWELGNVKEKEKFTDGRESILNKKEKGRYNLVIGTDTIDVYVLKEIIDN
jgi:hypothetical protein